MCDLVCAGGAERAGDARDIRRHLTRTKTENNNNLLLTDTRLKKTRTVRTWGERGPRAAGEGWKWRGGMIGVVGEMGESGRVWGRVCMMKEAPTAVLGGVLGAAGVVRPVLHAAAPPQESPAHAPHKRGVNATRGGGNGRGGGPTRWGERGAAVGRCAGQWTGVRGLGRRWAG